MNDDEGEAAAGSAMAPPTVTWADFWLETDTECTADAIKYHLRIETYPICTSCAAIRCASVPYLVTRGNTNHHWHQP